MQTFENYLPIHRFVLQMLTSKKTESRDEVIETSNANVELIISHPYWKRDNLGGWPKLYSCITCPRDPFEHDHVGQHLQRSIEPLWRQFLRPRHALGWPEELQNVHSIGWALGSTSWRRNCWVSARRTLKAFRIATINPKIYRKGECVAVTHRIVELRDFLFTWFCQGSPWGWWSMNTCSSTHLS